MEKNEKLVQDMLDDVKALKLGAVETKKLTDQIEGLATKIDNANKDELKKLDDALNLVNTEVKALKEAKADVNHKSLESAITEMLSTPEFKSAKTKKFVGGYATEVKVDTTSITGTVNMTQQNLSVNFAPETPLTFIPYLNVGSVGSEKARVLWMEGAYTSNAGYVGEGVAATSDTGTAAEKTRDFAKVSARLPLSAEMLEDANYIASALRMKMQEKGMIFADGEIYAGNGSDGVQPKHIYGIKGHATAFNATTAGVALAVENANIGDLVDSMILQAEKKDFNGANILWINPSDFFKFKTAKATDGQYLFVKDVNGNYSINGLRVVRSNRVPVNEMTIGDTSKIQLWWKRRPEIKFSQLNGTDFVDDMYTAVMFLRAQVVVEGPDKLSLIHASDITASITAIKSV